MARISSKYCFYWIYCWSSAVGLSQWLPWVCNFLTTNNLTQLAPLSLVLSVCLFGRIWTFSWTHSGVIPQGLVLGFAAAVICLLCFALPEIQTFTGKCTLNFKPPVSLACPRPCYLLKVQYMCLHRSGTSRWHWECLWYLSSWRTGQQEGRGTNVALVVREWCKWQKRDAGRDGLLQIWVVVIFFFQLQLVWNIYSIKTRDGYLGVTDTVFWRNSPHNTFMCISYADSSSTAVLVREIAWSLSDF